MCCCYYWCCSYSFDNYCDNYYYYYYLLECYTLAIVAVAILFAAAADVAVGVASAILVAVVVDDYDVEFVGGCGNGNFVVGSWAPAIANFASHTCRNTAATHIYMYVCIYFLNI